ncbi:hypothetical protein Tco_0134851 [Tanacetum coccineum]
MDPPGGPQSMVQTSQPKRSLTPVSSGPPSIKMPTSLSRTVTRANVKEKLHNVMRCLKTPSKFVKSLTCGASTLWARSRLHEGTKNMEFTSPSLLHRYHTHKQVASGVSKSWLEKNHLKDHRSSIERPKHASWRHPHALSVDCPDCEDSQFYHSSRVSHLQLQLGIRYPNLID